MESVFFKCLLFVLLQLTWADGETKGRSDVEKDILQNIFVTSKFHMYVRPDKSGAQTDEPLDVFVSLYILNSELDVKSQECTIHMYFRQEWNDSRLSYDDQGKIKVLSTHDAIGLWTPDLFFVNEKFGHLHVLTKPNLFVRIYPKGRVLYSQRITVKFVCPMDLRKYPFDTQICVLPIESYGYTASDILLKWKPDITFGLSEPPGFQISYSTNEEIIQLASGNYSRIELDIHFNRLAYSQLIHVYIPLALLVVASWTSFYLRASDQIPRLTATVVTTLTALMLLLSVKEFLYQLSYLTALDVWVGFSCLLLFATVFENIYAVTRHDKSMTFQADGISNKKDIPELSSGGKDKRKFGDILTGSSNVDAIARMAFPSVFVLFNVIYLVYYLI